MTELVPYRPRAELALPAANDTDSWTTVLNEVASLASQIANTPFVPDGLRGSAPAVAAAILSGRELGLGPMTSLANIHVIKGKPALSAALMRALILAQGHQIETVDISDTRAQIRGRRRGESEWEVATFTADQARQARIDLGGYPQDKLYARATSRLARRKFADVIAGMPYSAEELEDGGDIRAGGVTLPGEPAMQAAEPDKPRTAQRKQRTPTSPPAQAATPSAAPANPVQDAGGDLPPLPGEDEPDPTTSGASYSARAPGSGSRAKTAEPSPSSPAGSASTPDDTDYDTPGTATTPQITAIWTVFSNVYEFSRDEKDQARMVCAYIVEHDLASTKDLSRNEAKAILDTLSHWQHQAAEKNEHPRTYMLALMVAGDGEHGGA